uniref:Uncharacterized protein n=1 Tax=Pseudo-nitzschia australis TaxID=44445 RepID=A0A6U9ZPQ8_9STRA
MEDSRDQCEDEDDRGRMWYSAAKEDGTDAIATINQLKTFSWDSNGEDSVGSFGISRRNCFTIDDEDISFWTKTNLRPQQSIKRRKTTTMDTTIIQPPIVVSPEMSQPAATIEISLDSLPAGYETLLESLVLNDGRDDTRSELAAKEKDDLALLFPFANDSHSSKTANGAPEIKPSPSCYHDSRCRGENLRDGWAASKTMESVNYLKIPQDLFCSDVYKLLQPALPLPESLRAVLCLLLHMEHWSSTMMTHSNRTDLMKCACEIVNGTLLQCEYDESSSNRRIDNNSNSNSSKSTNIPEKFRKNISGKILDALVERLGSSVDLVVLLQASAQANNDLATANDHRLDIFFCQKVHDERSEQQEWPGSMRPRTFGETNNRLCFPCQPSAERNGGQKRKARAKANEKHHSSENRSELVSTTLRFAVAFGAYHYYSRSTHRDDQLLTLTGRRSMTLEDFVDSVSRDLEYADQNEMRRSWNTLEKVWDGRSREM